MLTNGHKLAGSGAGLVIICFFMPWILVSCSGEPVASMSGWNLAAGSTVQTFLGPQEIPGSNILFLILAAAIGSLLSVYYAWSKHAVGITNTLLILGFGIVGMAVLVSRFFSAYKETTQYYLTVDFQIGLWGVVGGLLTIIVGAIYSFLKLIPLQSREARESNQIPPGPVAHNQAMRPESPTSVIRVLHPLPGSSNNSIRVVSSTPLNPESGVRVISRQSTKQDDDNEENSSI